MCLNRLLKSLTTTTLKLEPVKDPKDVLDKEKSLQALAALRHAKWFQVRFIELHLLRLLY